jgi:hypothetical protein
VAGRHGKIDLYVNKQHIASVLNNTFSSGQVGVIGSSYANLTDVMFSNAQVWTF